MTRAAGFKRSSRCLRSFWQLSLVKTKTRINRVKKRTTLHAMDRCIQWWVISIIKSIKNGKVSDLYGIAYIILKKLSSLVLDMTLELVTVILLRKHLPWASISVSSSSWDRAGANPGNTAELIGKVVETVILQKLHGELFAIDTTRPKNLTSE